MKFPITFVAGAVVGATLSYAASLVWRAPEVPAVVVDVGALKQDISRADQNTREARDALRIAQEELRVARTREVERAQVQPAAVIANPPPTATSNRAIMTYLGEPILPPAGTDPKYSASVVLASFKSLCESRGIRIEQLGVDATEFPFVLHGVLANGSDFFQHIDAELKTIPGYAYGGSSTGRSKDGRMYFSLNITPSSAYPRELSEAIDRRLMLRLQMISAAWTDSLRR